MMQIQEINWPVFSSKFYEKEQKAFESLCYLLFCSEFGQDKGIFRYKNQTGIETDPIDHEGEVVGWQAKFIETNIRTKKDELKDGITATKKKNPAITKILFYLNREFSESPKKDVKDPAYKTEIEDHAKSLGVKVEWRVPSHFERQLSLEKNRFLAQHFFNLDKCIVDFISELQQHTESILLPIHSKMIFKGSEIKIDRSAILSNLRKALSCSPLAILSGYGGSGKTAVVKELYERLKETAPFFVFKASEFNVKSLGELFGHYGPFTFADFLKEHESLSEKYVIIDSAETLADIGNQEVFQEFFLRLRKEGWRIIFTTRYGYLDDLKWQFVELFSSRAFEVVDVENIRREDLDSLAEKYGFAIPKSERLSELLLTPFYLNEYLQAYESGGESNTYSDFRRTIWNKKIQRSSYQKNNIHIEREKCFLEIARTRAESSSFCVTADNLNKEALKALEEDEIIKYDSDARGYFITHDTYEEWALDRVIGGKFNEARNSREFLKSLGSSLPIRRAFRIWLSEQLFENVNNVKALVEESIIDDQTEAFWKDEVLISVLLSDYAGSFFKDFEKKLLEDNEKLLMRMVFLLRIACKQIDEHLLSLIGLKKSQGMVLNTVFTIPKGRGWELAIDFIHSHKEQFGTRNMNKILPLLTDWNNKYTVGDTTRRASEIALNYYDQTETHGGYSRDETVTQLIRVILQGSQKIKSELSRIFDEVLTGRATSHRDKYYAIVKAVLTSLTDGVETIKALPEYVIKLADLYWFRVPTREFGGLRLGVEGDFCIVDRYDFKYFPASSIQTPLYQLLRYSFRPTIDFILAFTNKTAECFAKSDLGKREVEEIELIFDDGEIVKQYMCNRLWNMYRGTQVSTDLLESIHMALERYLLERAKATSKDILESLCIYILRNSQSSSLTAVVESVVFAEPAKLFNVAKILFRTKELFLYDTSRLLLDKSHKSQLLMLKASYPSLGNYEREFHDNERITACDDEHRKLSLENLAFQYQFIKSEDNPDFEKQREEIWRIWDEYYKRLPPEPEESEGDKTWRLYLARMDTRKMTVKTESAEQEGKTLITFEPDIDPKLKKHSEDSLQRINESWKHMSLHLWSNYRFKREQDQCKAYEQYERDPHLAINEVREIMDGITKGSDEHFLIFNRSIPAYSCAVLIRDFADALTHEEKLFCQSVIVEYASLPFVDGKYSYQISDGVEPATRSLPFLMKCLPEGKDDAKMLLFLLLLNPWPQIFNFATSAVLHDLWKISPENAQSILLGYLAFEPKYRALAAEIRKRNYKKQIYEYSEYEVQKEFWRRYEKELEKVSANAIRYEDVGDLRKLDLRALNTAFELIPLETDNDVHRILLSVILPMFAARVMSDESRHGRRKQEDEEKIDYEVQHRFLNKFAYFVLTSKKDDIPKYLKPFVEKFSDSRETADFLQEFITVEDSLNRYEEFWVIWDIFYQPVLEICKKGYFRYHGAEIIHNYLLAWPWWKETAKEWHSLQDRERFFLIKIAQEIGSYPPVFYSLCKILTDIGSRFLEDGISWLSDIIQRTPKLVSDKLEVNTVYYLENLIRKYVLTNRSKIKRTVKIKDAVMVILNFLVERGSITGYLLREDIL
jgi:hypothetical protein